MIELRTLTDGDFPALHSAFNLAFSDYAVPLQLTSEALREMFTRRGWVPELSIAAIDGDAIVGFTVNCIDGETAYDTGSGVVPSHRRTGLGKRMMEASLEILRAAGARRYQLEVLETNAAAIALYTACGFVERRRFQCWSFDSTADAVPMNVDRVEPSAEEVRAMWNVEPSWQNSSRSIARARQRHVTLGDEAGYAIVFPSNGDLPQLVVAPAARRRGHGRRLLERARAIAGKPLRILNVDDSNESIAAFLSACGATKTVRQIEMIREL